MSREISRDFPVWIDGTPTCPNCGGEVTCEYVDVNLHDCARTRQATPYVCLPCGWSSTTPLLTKDPDEQGIYDENIWE